METILDRLRGVGAACQQAAKRIAGYEKLLADPVVNAYPRDRELRAIEKLARAFPDAGLRSELERWLAGERARVDEARDEFRFGFGAELSRLLTESGLEARGQLPVLRVGMFSLRVDFEAGKAALSWGPEVERIGGGVVLEPAALVRAVRDAAEDLAARATEPEKLVGLLRKAYERARLTGGVEPGTRLPLSAVLAELVFLMQPKRFRADPARASFVEYPRIRFSHDLYRLRAAGPAETAGFHLRLHVATFDATTDKTKALWVPDNERGEGTYYSYLSFEKGA